MKKIILLLLLSPCLMAQQRKEARKFYGTFIENQKVFNYEFIHHPGAGHTFKVMPVTHTMVSVLESMKKLEESGKKAELSSLIGSLNSLNTSADGHKKALEEVDSLLKSKKAEDPEKLTLLQAIEKYAEIDTSLQAISKDLEVILNETKLTATRVSKIRVFAPDTSIEGFAEIKEILGAINLLKEGVDRYSDDNREDLNTELKARDIEKKKQAVDGIMNKNKQSLTRLREVHEELSRHVLTMLGILGGKERMETAFYEFDRDIFEGVLAQQLETIDGKYLKGLKEEKIKDKTRLEELATRLFYTLQTRLAFEDEKPIAGVLMLKSDKVTVYNKLSKSKRIKGVYKVNEVSLEFEDGLIKNIEAKILVDPNLPDFRFRNLKPIGITGKFHPDLLQNYDIYCRENKINFLTVKLGDLIAYYPVLRSYSENYAPENSVVKLIPSVGQTVLELEKESTSEILDVQIFSDLAGLRVGNPQGLIQAGIYRKITVNTRHLQHSYKDRYHSHTWLNYVTPEFFITKIDQKEPNYIYPDSSDLKSIELYKYQFIKFGAEVGLFKYSIPNAQLNFQLFGSIHWVGSNIVSKKDNVAAQSTTNTTVNPTRLFSNIYRAGGMIETKPESRWGASLRYVIPVRYAILNRELKLARGDIYNSKGFATLTFNGFLKTSPSNKFFFRWSYNRLDNGTFFHQMQLGVQSSLQRYVEDRK